MADIALAGITKKFGPNTALRGVDLDIKDGEFFVLLGQTGAGKTTTLRVIAGLEKPDAGKVMIEGQDATRWNTAQRDVALVLQQYSLYPRLTVRGNLEFPLKSRTQNFTPAEIKERVERAAETLQITQLLDRKVEKLSGGEMQRVSIGRAIVRSPRVFLMDEPLSALDANLRDVLRVELKKLHNELGATFVFVTHDQVEAMSMGDKIGVLNQGKLVQVGTPDEIYSRPLNTFVARSVGTPPMNLLDGVLKDSSAVLDAGGHAVPVSNPNGTDGQRLRFGVRPENIVISADAPASGYVFDIENHGVLKILTIDADGLHIHATVSAQTRIAINDPVRFGWKPDKVLFFNPETGRNLALT
ncbi:ABC transporter ATP-binding protein [Sedimentitalea todarodis]|uniref:ABC transporter ATP-binding protein n=1 Tax=Sedimentitalea todarodis TaxID=1631240 RepID=A0ABU3VDW3_9RHOB|nr:ABC transporter ATP-binding protein [Sedimentitalea todarodis]MDU9004210.1 ABC transporter ATP-binding protein [Sedimentitalea todarodis]